MWTIVDKIRLKPGTTAEQFEDWVKNRDYATCPELKSLASFQVTCVSKEADAPFHFFEVIQVDSKSAFEADMASEAFLGLVADFEQMAEVLESFEGERIDPGFMRP